MIHIQNFRIISRILGKFSEFLDDTLRLCLVLTTVTRGLGTEISVSLRTLNYGDSSFIKYIHRFLVLRTSSEASPPSSKKYHVVLKWFGDVM